MNSKCLLPFAILGSLLILFQSCEKGESGFAEGNETKISHYFNSESHNTGQNCMACHISGGSGEGWFTVAGTAYDTTKTIVNPNTTIKLYTGIGGTGSLKATIEVDAKGNFYTTSSVDFGDGLFPVILGKTGGQKQMSSKITTGQCASCHGITTDKLWVY